jgi:hypothetical protein
MSQSDFTSVVSGFGGTNQLQIVGNIIYSSNNSGGNINLYSYTIGDTGVVPVVNGIPSNSSIAIVGNNIYTGVFTSYSSSYPDGTIVKSDISNNTFIAYKNASNLEWSGLIYVSNMLIGIGNVGGGSYYTMTLTDGSPGTLTFATTYFTSSGSIPSGIAYSSTDNSYIYIMFTNGYINKIKLSDNTISEIDLSDLDITINGTSIYTQGLAIVGNYLLFGLNNSTTIPDDTYTIYVLDITNFSSPSIFTQYTAPDRIISLVTYNTSGSDYDIYYSSGGTLYKSTSAFCFNEGTKILCMNNHFKDDYIAIELLRIGDFVKTYKHGYRRVSKVIQGTLRNNPKKWNMCMYKMAKTPTNGLIEDLIVTGGHSILVDAISEEEQKRYDEMGIPSFSKLTIDNKHLLLSCCSDQFTPMQDNNRYNYYHLLLENNDDEEERFGIWANGILTETPNIKTVKK